MKTIGLLGGITWHSTAQYYRQINTGIAARLGPYRSARLLMHSIDYGSVRRAREDGDWRRLGRELTTAARGLAASGADGVFLCSNTIHRFADTIGAQINVPVIHIADALANRIQEHGHDTVGLLATAFTSTQPFYIQRLQAHGIRVIVCDPETIAALDRIILDELATGRTLPASRERFRQAISDLERQGAQTVALACTEIGLLVRSEDANVPLLDTTEVHASHAVRWALAP